MSIPVEYYGYLPQLDTFESKACVPTATVNTMAAMARTYPTLKTLIGSNGDITYQEIATARDILGAEYFYTSAPEGTPPARIIEGLQRYAADLDLAQELEIKFIGPDINGPLKDELGFNKTQEIKINSPSSESTITKTITTLNGTDPIVARSYRSADLTMEDIQKSLMSGDGLLVGLLYEDNKDGHMVSAVSLEWKDTNANGIAEVEENASLTIVDPLYPSKNYANATPGNIEREKKFHPLAEAKGPVRTTQIKLFSDEKNNSIKFEYDQYSVDFDEKTGEPLPDPGDSSNDKDEPKGTGSIPFVGIMKARKKKGNTFKAGAEDNVIELDPGRDRIIGGKGSDAFVISDPKSLEKGNSDKIIDFKLSQGDLIVLAGQDLKIKAIDLAYVSNKNEKKLAKRSDQTLIYQHKENWGFLYFNSNGDEPGLGNGGGEIIRLKGAPDLVDSDLFIS